MSKTNKKTDLKNLKQIDGKNDAAPEPISNYGKLDKFHRLEQLWGDDGAGEFGTFSASEYEGKLQDMNLGDLHHEAIKHGVLPNSNRQTVIKRLLTEHAKHIINYSEPPKVHNHPAPPDIMKILADGK